LTFALLLIAASAVPARAQTTTAEPPPSWGVFVNFAPTWKANSTFQEIFLAEGEPTVEGSDFTVGFVRGRNLGGHWGLGYTRKRIKNGTTLVNQGSESGDNFTVTYSDTLVFRDVYYDSLEVVVFIPFTTIKNRFQVGLNVGGGAGFPKGTIESTFVSVSTFTPPTGPPQTQTQTDESSGPAKDYIMSIQPLFKLEVLGAYIVTPGLKVTFGGGLNAPSTAAFSVGAVYLIGGK
jgi:hypothetical protein